MGDVDLRSLSDAVNLFYEAAITPEIWPEALKTLSDSFGATGSLFLYPNPRGEPWHACSPGLEEGVEVFFREGWYSQNYRQGGREFMLRKKVKTFTEADLLTARQLDHQAIQADFFNRFGLRAFVGFYAGQLQASIECGNRPVSDQQMASLHKVLPQLDQAARLATALGFARNQGSLDAFSAMRTGAALLDYKGRVMMMNPDGERLLRSAARITEGLIAPYDRTAAAPLMRMIGEAIHPELQLGRQVHDTVILKRPAGSWLLLRVAPVVTQRADMFQPAKAMLTIIDPSERPNIGQECLVRALGLTPAEARVARGLASGATLAEIADASNLSMKTVRTQLRSIFAKTETHRQSDLIALLTRIFLTSQ